MPWEAGHEEVPIEPISIESGEEETAPPEETGEVFEIELETSENEADITAEETEEADFSAPPVSEPATSEFTAGAGENGAEEISLEVESGTSEEETELSAGETPEIEINEDPETNEAPEIVEEQKEEKVWEIDFSSFDEPEKSGSGEELETDEAGFKSEFHLEQDEPEAEVAAPAGEPADAGEQNPFQSSVGPETEPELVLDLDRDAARDESEKADDASFEHSWGDAGNNTGDVFTDRVNGFYEGLEAKDHYEVLGVGKGSSNEQIRDAYYKLVKNYHPDVNPGADHDTRVKAEEIFTRITSAYETLSQNDKREEYDSQEELADLKNQAKYIYEAEMAFKKGITLLIQRNYAEAEKNIREAVTMNPEEAAYVGAHGWTRYLAAENKSSVLAESIKTLEQAIKMNGKIAENQYYLGSIYKNQNDLKNAEKCFQKAIEIEPDYIEAKRELRLINTRKMNARNDKKPEKRFWSSLFKR
ncbi:MAG: DnaJ domain-containing protein [Thermodesulfobacteriota bacterium]